jgi:hypothetical protein
MLTHVNLGFVLSKVVSFVNNNVTNPKSVNKNFIIDINANLVLEIKNRPNQSWFIRSLTIKPDCKIIGVKPADELVSS